VLYFAVLIALQHFDKPAPLGWADRRQASKQLRQWAAFLAFCSASDAFSAFSKGFLEDHRSRMEPIVQHKVRFR
jgi:hypothetical protein